VVAVDSLTGWAQGNAPGTATIVASSGSKSASSQVAVLPTEIVDDTVSAQAYEPDPSPPEQPQENPVEATGGVLDNSSAERERLDAAIRIGVSQCYDALRSKNVTRVAQLYRPTKRSDEDKLNKLTRILETEEWTAVVGERVDGARQLGTASAAAEFSFPLVWKDAFGGRLTSRPVFRAEFAKNGNEWEISSCRIVGSPKL
jgi:hypothetical protein